MDLYTTPVRNFSPHQFFPSTTHRSVSKQYILDLINSLDFSELLLPPCFFNSENEDDTPAFMEVIGQALTSAMVKKSPPKISPKKLLQLSTSRAPNELDTPTKMPKKHQSQEEEEQEQEEVIQSFLNTQPWLTRESIDVFDDDPQAKRRRLKMFKDFTPYFQQTTQGNASPTFICSGLTFPDNVPAPSSRMALPSMTPETRTRLESDPSNFREQLVRQKDEFLEFARTA